MATVTKRGRKWTAIYTDHLGKQCWRAGYADKAETLRLAQRLEDEERRIRMGDIDPQAEAARVERAKPIADHVAAFQAHMESKQRDPRHIAYTIRDIKLCIQFTEIARINQLTLQHIDRWRIHLQKVGVIDRHTEKPVPDSRKTINRRISSVRAFLHYCVATGAVASNILHGFQMLETKGHETFHRRSLTVAEASDLLTKCTHEHRREIYRFALRTGFRANEIRSMTPSSFDFKNRTVTVKANQAKYKGQHQIIPMHASLIAPLKRLCEEKKPDEPIFDVPNEKYLKGILQKHCTEAGIDTRDIDFHALRHSYISHLAEQNIRPEVLMKLARHRDIATTLRFYVHFRPDDERSAIDRL